MPDENLNVRDKYLEQMVDSASPEGLLILVVDAAVNFIRRALFAFEKEKFDEVNNNLIKAQNIYLELTLHLDLDAGEFAENLALVYQYLYNLMIEANIEKDEEKIKISLRLAEDIRDLWHDAVDKSKVDSKPATVKKSEILKINPVEIKPDPVRKSMVYDIRASDKKAAVEETPSRLNITG
ncbi:MAG: flagellar export chaperone FliS [bacterium]|nr:flagellar export chaperone FliS [bacterium]